MSDYFNPYEHMENHDRVPDVKWADPNIEFVCTEKIHGTNYSFLMKEQGVVVACKRTAVLKEKESFMNHQRVFDKYVAQVEALYAIVVTVHPTLAAMQLFGELFGGYYDGATTPQAKVVQRKMNYCPDNEFMAYDLKLSFPSTSPMYCDFTQLADWCKAVGIRTVPIFFEGSLQDCLQYQPITDSLVPAAFGLPPLKDGSASAAEGCVIRPKTEGLRMQNGKRFIFKKKNPLFREVNFLPKCIQSSFEKTAH